MSLLKISQLVKNGLVSPGSCLQKTIWVTSNTNQTAVIVSRNFMAGNSYFAEGGEKVPVDDVKEVSAEKKTKRPRKTRSTKKITEEIDNTKFKGSNVLKPFPNNTNPKTGEVGGPRGPEPTRFGDWERKGRVTDF